MTGSDEMGDLPLPWDRTSPAPGLTGQGRSRNAPSDRPDPEKEQVPAGRPTSSLSDPAPPLADGPPGPAVTEDVTWFDQRIDRFESEMRSRLDRLEEHVDGYEAAIDARIDKLASRLESAHEASVQAVGLLAGQVVARIEEQVSPLGAALEAHTAELRATLVSQHEMLMASLEGNQQATMQALKGLASGETVDTLRDGVIAMGDAMDEDVVQLRRMLDEQRAALGLPAGHAPQESREDPAGDDEGAG